jgi:single-stranded DNA-binding protein
MNQQEDLNEVRLRGTVASEPKLFRTGGGKAILKFRVHTQGQFRKEFHSIIAWEDLAEFNAGIVEGDRVEILGGNTTSSYDDKEGRKITRTEIRAEKIELIDGGKKRAVAHEPSTSDDDVPF